MSHRRSNPDALDRAVSGESNAPLTHDQKAALCILAGEAWELAGRPYFDDQAIDLPACLRLTKSDGLELWRHEQQEIACGKRHLTAATQRDYLALRSHFRRLLGRDEDADRDAARSGIQENKLALSKLDHECVAARDVIDRPHDYVGSIARTRYKAPVHDLSPRQIWVLIFDLRRNAQRRRKKVNH